MRRTVKEVIEHIPDGRYDEIKRWGERLRPILAKEVAERASLFGGCLTLRTDKHVYYVSDAGAVVIKLDQITAVAANSERFKIITDQFAISIPDTNYLWHDHFMELLEE